MKKILFWILTFLWIWLSFCSAENLNVSLDNIWWSSKTWQLTLDTDSIYCFYASYNSSTRYVVFDFQWYNWNLPNWWWNWVVCFSVLNENENIVNYELGGGSYVQFYYFKFPYSQWWSSTSDIDVYYNNWNSVENITCDWTQAISINWLSTITSTNTFTPYYNISYIDEDNQKLIESYSKDVLYLENWQFKKTYTWNNDWILSVQWGSDNSFSWYLPTFDITWSVDPNDEFTWNVFNNFADNSLKFLFSNIPSYIQYFIILLILFLILWFVKKFKRK